MARSQVIARYSLAPYLSIPRCTWRSWTRCPGFKMLAVIYALSHWSERLAEGISSLGLTSHDPDALSANVHYTVGFVLCTKLGGHVFYIRGVTANTMPILVVFVVTVEESLG